MPNIIVVLIGLASMLIGAIAGLLKGKNGLMFGTLVMGATFVIAFIVVGIVWMS